MSGAGGAGPWVGRGHGKLVLCGEHAVVYGTPAIAFAVDRGTRVSLRESRDGPADARLARAVAVATGTDRREAERWEAEITTDLPVGRGMGSSAALAVALVRAAAAARGEAPPDPDEVFSRAMPIERLFHGNPSGLDVAVAARGGALLFRRGSPPTIAPLRVERAWRVVVLDSGTAGDTGAMVAAVAARRPGIDPTLDAIGDLVGRAVASLDDPRALGGLLSENHRLLGLLGVSTPVLDDLVGLALEAGAYGAKLSGAGGGGVVLALVDDPTPVLDAARARGVPAFEAHLVGASA